MRTAIVIFAGLVGGALATATKVPSLVLQQVHYAFNPNATGSSVASLALFA